MSRTTHHSHTGIVVAVSRSGVHDFSKSPCEAITLLAGLGVDGDAHAGETVQHRSRVRKDPTQPNLRQVHLLHEGLLDELGRRGFDVAPGRLGENVTTAGIELLDLPRDALLAIGATAVVRITGLRNPCAQLDAYQQGLTAAVLDRDAEGNLIRKAGVMGVVETGGVVRTGDPIRVVYPPMPHVPLERV